MNSRLRYTLSSLSRLKLRWLIALSATLLSGISGGYAADKSFPDRPVRIIVGFGPGGTADIIARLLSEQLTELWAQPVLVVNRPGASGAIGSDIVAKSAKDGHTMGTISSTFTILPALGQKLSYDAHKDFVILNRIIEVPYLLVAGSGPNVANTKSVADFLAAARTKPKQLSYASSGPGSTEHLASELLAAAAKVEFLHVPYKGSGDAIPDVMAGRVDFTFSAIPDLIGFVRNKTLRAVAIGATKRLSILPDVPTLAETLPGFEIGQWFALAAPSGIPRPVLERLNADLGKAVTSPKLKQAWDERLVTPTSFSLKETDDYYRAQLARWDRIVKQLGLDKQNN